MLTSVLIANRGEIARRIIRTLGDLGIRSIAIYAENDPSKVHAEEADQAVLLEGQTVAETYLSAAQIIRVARLTGAQAIHPGYGFLSEDPAFAKAVEEAGLVFLGPKSDTIAQLGHKAKAKELANSLGVPTLGSYFSKDQDLEAYGREAEVMGYPVMLKAVAGGGGRGIRLVEHAPDFAEAFARSASEAEKSFGNGELLLEKSLRCARHVEVQILGDQHGQVLALGERDCSLQRRHQKILEETPAPCLEPEKRQILFDAAIQMAQGCQYQGAGTVEFLVGEGDDFYFLEMNPRLQVEHPVTEMALGIDLVAWQVKVASGLSLAPLKEHLAQKKPSFAIEARLCCEDPAADFLPQTGPMAALQLPQEGPFVRIDHAMAEGQDVSPYYDPMIAKIIVQGDSREEALQRLEKALGDLQLLGVKHNRDFLLACLNHEGFRSGQHTTATLGEMTVESTAQFKEAAIAGALELFGPQKSWPSWQDRLPRGTMPPVRLKLKQGEHGYLVLVTKRAEHFQVQVTLEGESQCFKFQMASLGAGHFQVQGEDDFVRFFACQTGTETWVGTSQSVAMFQKGSLLPEPKGQGAAKGVVTAPMAGVITVSSVSSGQKVIKGDTLFVLESMKMEYQIKAEANQEVKASLVQPGQQVSLGQVLVEFTQ